MVGSVVEVQLPIAPLEQKKTILVIKAHSISYAKIQTT